YPDRPGIMGRVGTLLGEAGINIEAAQISQTTDKTDAIMLLRVDRLVDAHLLDPIGATVGAKLGRTVCCDRRPWCRGPSDTDGLRHRRDPVPGCRRSVVCGGR